MTSPWTATGTWTTDAGRTYSSTDGDTLELSNTSTAIGNYMFQFTIDTSGGRGIVNVAVDNGAGSYTTMITSMNNSTVDTYSPTTSVPFIVTTASVTVKLKITVGAGGGTNFCVANWFLIRM